jgi:hypothetical protein
MYEHYPHFGTNIVLRELPQPLSTKLDERALLSCIHRVPRDIF